MRPRKSAGLPLSVGAASLLVRVLLSAIVLVASTVSVAAGVLLGRRGPLPAAMIAGGLLIPFGIIALLGAAFIAAPHSRFGKWLDHSLDAQRLARAAGAIWMLSILITWIARR